MNPILIIEPVRHACDAVGAPTVSRTGKYWELFADILYLDHTDMIE